MSQVVLSKEAAKDFVAMRRKVLGRRNDVRQKGVKTSGGGGGSANLPSGLMGQVLMSTTDGSPAQMSFMFVGTPS